MCRAAWGILLLAACVPRSATGAAPEAAPDPDPAEVRRVFESVERRFDAVTTLSFFARRTLRSADGDRSDQWMFHLKRPDCLRIEYSADVTRTIVMNPREMWEYVPQARRAVRTDLSTMTADERLELVSRCMSRIAIDGLRLGAYAHLAASITRCEVAPADGGTGSVWVVEGRDPRFELRIEPQRGVLLASRLYRGEELFLTTRASGFKPVGSDLWMPTRVEGMHYREDRRVAWTVAIRNAQAGHELAADTFEFRVPEGIAVVDK